MKVGLTIACPLLVFGLLGPLSVEAQQRTAPKEEAPAEKPGLPVTDLEKRGEALFWRDCSLCHVDPGSPRFNHRSRNTLGIVAPTDLVGLFKQPSITDAIVRGVIQDGIAGRMPAFKYTYELKPQALDQLIAYLKVR